MKNRCYFLKKYAFAACRKPCKSSFGWSDNLQQTVRTKSVDGVKVNNCESIYYIR